MKCHFAISWMILSLQDGKKLSSQPGQCLWRELHLLLEGFLCLGLFDRKLRGCREQRSCHRQQHQGQTQVTLCTHTHTLCLTRRYCPCTPVSVSHEQCCPSAVLHQQLWTGSYCRGARKEEGNQLVRVFTVTAFYVTLWEHDEPFIVV